MNFLTMGLFLSFLFLLDTASLAKMSERSPCNRENYQEYVYNRAKTKRLIKTTGRGCDLARADLRGESLVGAVFWRADLEGANLSGMDLAGVDFRGGKLTGADLRGTDLSRSLLHKANLNGVISDEATHFPERGPEVDPSFSVLPPLLVIRFLGL